MDVQAHGLFIGGRTVPSASESMTEILDPATNHALARVAAGTKDDVNAAVEAARNAFDSPEWRGPDSRKSGPGLWRLRQQTQGYFPEPSRLRGAPGRKTRPQPRSQPSPGL